MKRTTITGFYSYKGGVGRSMALAHCAVEKARQGRKVLIIDLDLEAPGQHCTSLFDGQFNGFDSKQRKGFINFSQDFKKSRLQGLPELEKYIVKTPEVFRDKPDAVPGKGQVFLLPAGEVGDPEEYRKSLRSFEWPDAMSNEFALLVHLKAEFRRLGFDDVLIDSRTGDSDPFYVVALELANILVVVSGYNRQNLIGTQTQIELLERFPVARQPTHTLLVLSPKPLAFDEDKWRTFIRPLAPKLPEPVAELPYDSRLATSENILLDDLINKRGDYATGIEKMMIALDNPPPKHIAPLNNLVNPFSVIRADYASSKELSRLFVDPGEAVTRALRDFMPVMVYGNRGTGKTMLAKYFSYEAMLDRLGRAATPQDWPEQEPLGLYLRFDIDLLNCFNTRDSELRPHFYQLFSNFFDILVLRKALNALNAFGGLSAWCDPKRLFRIFYREFGEHDLAQVTTEINLNEFLDFIDEHFSRIRIYLNNPSKENLPFKIQSNICMKLLMEVLLSDSRKVFGERWFAVMVDEVEHFEIYQQKVLNSRIKQIKRDDRTTFRYFLRHEGLRTHATVVTAQQDEQQQIIQEAHDFRTLKLDEGLSSMQFENHVKEIAALQLKLNPQIGRIRLAEQQYQVNQLLENWTLEQEAQYHVNKSKKEDEVKKWLAKGRKLSPLFWNWYNNQSDAVLRRVVAGFLINQGKDADQVAQGFTEWSNEARAWYHNYSAAALYKLCRLYGAKRKYGGFNDVLMLSGQNVRYFLEYLRAIVDEWMVEANENPEQGMQLPISIVVQNKAIQTRAQFYIDALRGKPRYAEQMLNVVRRLGNIFSAMHSLDRQSQFEVNHFSIGDYEGNAQPSLNLYLRECRMENVLLRRHGNKHKSTRDQRLDDWVLHPCFAPYFNISLRRKKKLEELSSTDLLKLFDGKEEDYKYVISPLTKNSFTTNSERGLFEGPDDESDQND